MVGLVLGFKRQYDASVAELERALLLNPNYTDWRFAMALVIAGEYARAIDAAQAHMRADPFYPPRTALWLGVAYFMLKRYPDALPHLLEAVSRAPNTLGCHLWSAANFAQLKRLQEARGEICKVLQIDPEFSIERQRRVMAVCKHQKDVAYHLDGLRKAGLPSR